MKENRHKYYIVIALTLISATAVFKVNQAESIKNNKIFSFPLTIGEWSGKKIVMEKWVYDSLETPYSFLHNYYLPNGEEVNLTIVWFDDKNIAFHAPEACLGGVGNLVKKKSLETVDLGDKGVIQIGSLLAETKGGRKSLVYYYFITDGFTTPDQTEARKKVLYTRLMFKRTSAAFVRLMTTVNDRPDEAKFRLEGFLKLIIPLVPKYTDTKNIL